MIIKIADYLVLGEGIGVRFITPEGRYIGVDIPWDGREKVTRERILVAIRQRLSRESKEEVVAEVLRPMLYQEFDIVVGSAGGLG